MENIKNVIEAIIFSSGSPIEKKELTEKLPELTTQKLNSIVKELQKKYSDESGVLLIEFNGKLQFTSNPRYGETVADVLTPLKEKELSRTLLEVLSTIAYKQPVTRLEIDDMRSGTGSEYAISALLKAGLVQAVGRKDTVGRPMLYGTTDEFLKKFQLESLDGLPDHSEVLEKIQLIYAPMQETLFRERTIEDEGDGERDDVQIAEEAAADVIEQSTEAIDEAMDDMDDEIPEFLQGEEISVITGD